MHQVEGVVYAVQLHGVRDHPVHLDLTRQVLIHHARQVAAPPHAAECGAAPHAAGYELKRAGCDFLAGAGHADDGAFAPALVAALKRCTHQLHVTHTFKRVIDAAIGEIHNDFLYRRAVIPGVNQVGGAQLAGHLELGRIDVDADDAFGARHHRSLDHAEADTAQSEDRDARTGPYFGRVEHCADTGGDAAAQQANLVQRGGRVDFGQCDLGQNGVFRERRSAHVMKHRLAATGKTAAAVRHEPLALGLAYGLTEIGQAGFAEFAFAALRGVERNNVVAGFHAAYPRTDLFHDPAALVAEYGRKCALRVRARQGKGVGVTNAGCNNAHQGFSLARTLHVHSFNPKRLSGAPGYGCSRFH